MLTRVLLVFVLVMLLAAPAFTLVPRAVFVELSSATCGPTCPYAVEGLAIMSDRYDSVEYFTTAQVSAQL